MSILLLDVLWRCTRLTRFVRSFIIEGLITVALGLISVFIIVPFPDKATMKGLFGRKPFLSARQASIVMARLEKDRGDAVSDEMTMRNVLRYICDWKVLEWAWLYLIAATVSYSFSLFLPIILQNDLGYSTVQAQVLSFPPYAVAAPWMLITAWIGDRYRKRGHLIIFNARARGNRSCHMESHDEMESHCTCQSDAA